MGCTTTSSHAKVLPAGKCYIDQITDGNPTGEVLFSECENLTLSVATEEFSEYGGDGQIAELQMRFPTRIDRTGTLIGKGITADNLARFVIGGVSTITTSATPVADESINGGRALVGGAWYQLGATTNRPQGIRDVGSVVITYGSGPTTATAGTAYILDADLARFQVVDGGVLDGATTVLADYTPVAGSWESVQSSADLDEINVRLRWVADNLQGTNRDLYCPCVIMRPEGDLSWKSAERNTVQQMSFSLTFVGTVYIDGRPA